MSVVDCYLFVMLRWADKFGVAVPELLMDARPSVQAALEREERAAARRPQRGGGRVAFWASIPHAAAFAGRAVGSKSS